MIQVEHVSRRFGTFRAVDDISFDIQTGEIVGLLGPNGAGKTTTMRMITGFLEPTDGTIKIDGLNVVDYPVESKAKIGYMPESAPLYGEMIVEDYLSYVAKMNGCDPAARIPELVEICGLKEVMHKNISELSRGNKQRVGLAHALMGNPEILILDEPTSGLDPNQVSEVRALIKKIGETRTVIISTHILSEVEMLCSRVIIISKGKKVADSSTQELQEHYGHSGIVRLTVDAPSENQLRQKLMAVSGVDTCTVSEDAEGFLQATVGIKTDEEIRHKLAKTVVKNDWGLYALEMQKNSLEDVFRALTTGGEER
ncbi:MAG: ABC transporter ATP-binding protein [Treponema sp.]|nr:ABC transporter ATP-binding protein [Treponema sp.]MBQ2552623.1 ABC transporter ATP-binding protein [Treponema sp.]MBQ4236427.1 ABC transporter ATP-binding protein [Treponema sp.]